ncbi:hypothetical protein DBB42_28230 [Pseudomonas plecoglossicida]|uniref:Uncharacterized protein n=1 Tax=Pseudomonas plecoglossicida TaxID=70775 RepID=A0A2R7UAT1_PSEDL|nr:hypothetical protein DBB42_28230 [Pseudomonas plecoglossicida]
MPIASCTTSWGSISRGWRCCSSRLESTPARAGRRGFCGSGRAREESSAVAGTGCAGVRGRARSHRAPFKFPVVVKRATAGAPRTAIMRSQSRLLVLHGCGF